MAGLKGFEDGLFSIGGLEVRCIHDHVVDTTKQTTQFVHIERLCLLPASLDTVCLGLQCSIQGTRVVCLTGPCRFCDRSKSNAGSAALPGAGMNSTSRTASGSLPCFLFLQRGLVCNVDCQDLGARWPLEVVSEKA